MCTGPCDDSSHPMTLDTRRRATEHAVRASALRATDGERGDAAGVRRVEAIGERAARR